MMHHLSTKIVPLVVGCLTVVSGWVEGFFQGSWDSGCVERNSRLLPSMGLP